MQLENIKINHVFNVPVEVDTARQKDFASYSETIEQKHGLFYFQKDSLDGVDRLTYFCYDNK